MFSNSFRHSPKRRRTEGAIHSWTKHVEYTNESYTIGWLCALEVEQAAAQGMLDTRHPPLLTSKGDTNSYRFGSIGGHNVVIAVSRSAGTSPAAIAATNLLRSFPNIRFVLMVGIGGGAPTISPDTDPMKDIRLGDIVVSSPSDKHGGVIQYDLGKSLQDDKFVLTGSLNGCPATLGTAIIGLQGDARLDDCSIRSLVDELCARHPSGDFQYPGSAVDTLFTSDSNHVDGEKDCNKCLKPLQRKQRSKPEVPVVHYGLIGSANQVLRDPVKRDRFRQELGILCFEMEAAGLMDDFPCLVIRGIGDYCDSHKNDKWQPYAAAVAAAYAKKLLLTIAYESVTEQKSTHAIPEKLGDIFLTVQGFQNSIRRMEDKFVFDRLPEADRASFDSIVLEDEEVDYICLEDTRTELLQQIREWVLSSPSKSIFWVSGAAGTGKSTIARTIAHEFSRAGRLGASFFFKRNRGDRDNASRLFTTIAAQLARNVASIKPEIAKALEKDPRIAEKGLPEQFDKLILQPLSNCRSSSRSTLLIVIDALDECEGDFHIESIIGLLARTERLTNMKLRVFLTSRPELPIQFGFRKLPNTSFEGMILQDIPQETTKHDLLEYLKAKFTRIQIENPHLPPDWPGEEILKRLADMACPMFIYAATVCRFIADRFSEPQYQLDVILERYDHSLDQISNTYLPILQRLTQTQTFQRAQWLHDFRDILGCIIVGFESLNINTLASFVDIEPYHVRKKLDALHSVLNIPNREESPVTLHHLSFANFLLDGKHQHEHDFWINKQEFHRYMATRCLDLLLNSPHLRQDICGLKTPGYLRKDIDQGLISQNLPANLRYACRYWIRHSIESQHWDSLLEEQALLLFRTRFLPWFEALSLLGRASELRPMIIDLLNAYSHSKSLAMILEDARRFVLESFPLVNQTPLQLYSSCIIFTPQLSFVRQGWIAPSWIRKLPKTPMNWKVMVQNLQAPTSMMTKLLYLPRNRILITAEENGTIQLVDARTASLRQRIENVIQSPCALACSLDERVWAVASRDGKIELRSIHFQLIWQKTVKNGGHSISALALSPDSKYLAFGGTDGTIELRRLTLASREAKLVARHEKGFPGSLAFSPDGKLLVCGWSDNILMVWIMDSERIKLHQTIYGHGAANRVLFTRSSKFLITGSREEINLWSVSPTDSRLYHISSVRLEKANDFALSADEKLLAVDTSETIQIFVVTQEGFLPRGRIFTAIPEYSTQALVFVAEQNLLATVSPEQGTRLWDVNLVGIHQDELIEQPKPISRLAFSSDGTLLSSNSASSTPKIWNITSGKPTLQHLLAGNSRSEAFSPDSNLVACDSDTGIISIYSATSGQLLHELHGQNTNDHFMAFSSNGMFLTSSCTQPETNTTYIDIWDTVTWALQHALSVQEASFDKVVCSFDARLLALARAEGGTTRLVLWDVIHQCRLSSIEQAEPVNWLRFLESSSCLETNSGIYDIQGGTFVPLSRPKREGFSQQDDWIVWNGQKILWLPYDYRNAFTSRGNVIALGSTMGTVHMIEISSLELRKQGLVEIDEVEDTVL